jgi:hypothetical protein
MDPLIGIFGVTSVTTVVQHVAGYQNLGSQIDVRPLGFSYDFDPIAEGGSHCMGPAGPAIDWEMLVALQSQIVSIVDIAPPIFLGKLVNGNLFQWSYHVWLEGG